MTANKDNSPEEIAAEAGAPERPRIARSYLLAGAGICIALVILYGMMLVRGKDSASKLASDCAPSAPISAKIRPIAVGQLAALAVPKSPKPATNITFEGPDGKKQTLADFKGKTILLNLWATWCVPCRAEMPALDRLQQAMGSDNFEVVAVNIDTARLERRKPFLNSVGVKHLKFYADPKADSFQVLKQAGKVIGLPTTFLIDAKGCELGRMAGPAEWDSDLAKTLIRAALTK